MMDFGMIEAKINNLRSDIEDQMSPGQFDLGFEQFDTTMAPPIGGGETQKPFDLERDEDGVLRMVRNIFMSGGELYELEDKEIPEGTKWIWLKTVAECEDSDDGNDHYVKLMHSIEFEKGEESGKRELWKPVYKLTDDLEVEIDFRSCQHEDGLEMRTMKCVMPVVYSPDDPSLNETLYPKYEIRACNDIELSWATLMMGSDGAYYIYQDGKSVKISNKDGEDGEDGEGGEGGAVSGYTGTVIEATNPRYDEGLHQLLYTPVSMKFENGLMKSIETGSESVIAQAVEESA